MELQLEKYQNLISYLSHEMAPKNGYYSKQDCEQELWLKLYEFVRLGLGDVENFYLVKAVLRNHMFDLMRSQGFQLSLEFRSIEDLIVQGVVFIYPKFDPSQECESREIGWLVNEWFHQQDPKTQEFILECVADCDEKVMFHKVRRKLNIGTRAGYRMISSLRNFLVKKGVTYVSSKCKK